ncbi:hypothetical protein FJY71_01240 [candidate division WOR-3 bacterium]|nr:hypothetical protein [candidate division WOR-3 bacterium]
MSVNPVRFFPPLTPAPGATEVPRMDSLGVVEDIRRCLRCECGEVFTASVDADEVALPESRDYIQQHIDDCHRPQP